MGSEHFLYVRYSTYSSKTGSGCPADIPLSTEPYCGIRHFDKVAFVFTEIMYWCRNDSIDRYMIENSNDPVPENDCVFIAIKKSAIIDLRDELIRISKGEESELITDDDFYCRFDGEGKDKVRARENARTLDKYLHDDNVEFYYENSW